MFDSIRFKCEVCDEEIEAQSKSGGCHLDSYEPTEVPYDVAQDANRHAPFTCKCGAVYKFGIPQPPTTVRLEVIRL